MQRYDWRFLLLAGMLVMFWGCATETGSQYRRAIGYGGAGLSVIEIDAPVHAEQPVILTVITYGSSSCTEPDGAEMTMRGMEATITPYDRYPRERDVACTADRMPFPRPVVVTFPEAGDATIRVRVRTADDDTMIYERTITVLP